MKTDSVGPLRRISPRHLQRLRVAIVGDHHSRGRAAARSDPYARPVPVVASRYTPSGRTASSSMRFVRHYGDVHTASLQPCRLQFVHGPLTGDRRRRCASAPRKSLRSKLRCGPCTHTDRTGCVFQSQFAPQFRGEDDPPLAVHLRLGAEIRGVESHVLAPAPDLRGTSPKTFRFAATPASGIFALCGGPGS